MTETERLVLATQHLKAAAINWSRDALRNTPNEPLASLDDQNARLQTLLRAATAYAVCKANFETWIRALPPPRTLPPPG